MATDDYDTSFLKGGRYVYFSSLRDEPLDQLRNLATHAENYLQIKNAIINSNNNNNSSIQYINNYINTLEGIANSEFSAEQQFINNLKNNSPVKLNIDSYYNTDGSFDYLKFIAMLNELEVDDTLLKGNLNNRIERIKGVEEALNKMRSQFITQKDEWGQEEITTQYNKIMTEYAHRYRNYQIEIVKQLTRTLPKSITTEVSNYINTQISVLMKNDEFLQSLIDTHGNITGEQVVGLIVNEISDEFKNWKIGPKLERSIDQKFQNLSTGQQAQELIKSLQYNLENILSKSQTTLEKVFDQSLSGRNEIGKLLEDSETDYNNLILILSKSQDTDQELIDSITKAYNNLKNLKSKNDETKKLSNARGQLTLAVNKAIKNIMHIKPEDFINKKDRQAIIADLLMQYNNIINSSATQILQQYLANHRITAPMTGELLAQPGVIRQIIGIISSYQPGSEITAKADIVFEYTPNDISNFFSAVQNSSVNINEIETITKFSKEFLEEYKKKAKGATDISAAEQAWITTQEKNIKQQASLLRKAKTKKEKENLKKFFQNMIHGQISVKTYEFYNDSLGFHEGSLGGSGKVVNAIPNIIKMMELGGLGQLDAELIINILLNCFEDSVIGTSQWDDIKNLLIGGAAMMLFDDGFANAENFLKNVSSKLKPGTSFGKTVHLLVLNGVYVPQSFLLKRIVNQLKIIQKDILLKNKELNTNPEKLLEKGKDQLVLSNPLTGLSLTDIYLDPETKEKNKAYRWNKMSAQAQESVTISFLFMSGMLDIMEQLASAFNPQ